MLLCWERQFLASTSTITGVAEIEVVIWATGRALSLWMWVVHACVSMCVEGEGQQ